MLARSGAVAEPAKKRGRPCIGIGRKRLGDETRDFFVTHRRTLGAGRFWSFLQESREAPLHAFAVKPLGRLFDRVTQAPHVKRGASTSEETAKSRVAGDEVIAETVGL